jgi:hypothetical protein
LPPVSGTAGTEGDGPEGDAGTGVCGPGVDVPIVDECVPAEQSAAEARRAAYDDVWLGLAGWVEDER